MVKNEELKNKKEGLKKKGFTLLELIAVLVILAALSSIAIPIFTNKGGMARELSHNANVALLQRQAQSYLLTTDNIPEDGDDIIDLLVSNGYIKEKPQNPIKDADPYTIIYNAGTGKATVLPPEVEVTNTAAGGSVGGGTGGGVETPGPTLEITANTGDPTEQQSIIYTFKFSEAVTGFDATDVTIENGTSISFIEIDSTEYNMVVTNAGPCVQTISVASGACKAANNKGNQAATKSITIIDETAPTAPTYSVTPDTVTNTDVTVTVIYSDDSIIKQYKKQSENIWKEYISPVIITENDTVYARASDASGNTSAESSILINYIDKIPPAAPVANVVTGTYGASQNVTLTGEAGATIRYTTNGTDPTTASTVYGSAIEINTTTTLKAVQWDIAGNASTVATHTYTISLAYNGTHNIPQLDPAMTPVKWIGTTLTDTTKTDPDWYKYNGDIASTVGGTQYTADKWANARLNDGSLFVWIPRYTYKIDSASKRISIKYSEGTDDSTTDGYIPHPAFEFDSKQLKGIWIAKFEASSNGGQVQVKPGISSWRSINVSDMFDKCLAMKVQRGLAPTSDTHLTKNSEWGAVAYLTEAIRDGNEVWINNSTGFITGSAGNSVSAGSGTNTDYTSAQGQKASTTGNVYGVYDMSGGALEYVAAYIPNGHANLTTYSSSLLSATSKYVELYTAHADDNSTYWPNLANTQSIVNKNFMMWSGIKGDGIYETSYKTPTASVAGYNDALLEWQGDANSDWYGDYTLGGWERRQVFLRGGANIHEANAGIFAFNCTAGDPNSYRSFRPVVLVGVIE